MLPAAMRPKPPPGSTPFSAAGPVKLPARTGAVRLDGQVTLLEFRNGKPVVRGQAAAAVQTGAWHSLQVDLRDGRITGSLDGSEVCAYQAERPLDGYLGLWTKADSVTLFQDLAAQPPDRPACLLG